MRNTAMGGVAGLVISLGIIFLTVLLDNKINTEEDVTKYLDLTVVGVIPEYEGGKRNEQACKKPSQTVHGRSRCPVPVYRGL